MAAIEGGQFGGRPGGPADTEHCGRVRLVQLSTKSRRVFAYAQRLTCEGVDESGRELIDEVTRRRSAPRVATMDGAQGNHVRETCSLVRLCGRCRGRQAVEAARAKAAEAGIVGIAARGILNAGYRYCLNFVILCSGSAFATFGAFASTNNRLGASTIRWRRCQASYDTRGHAQCTRLRSTRPRSPSGTRGNGQSRPLICSTASSVRLLAHAPTAPDTLNSGSE